MEWYSRFEVLVTGGILSPSVTRELHLAGCRLVAYDWSSAFYPGDAVSADLGWQKTVLARGRDWRLNMDPVGGGAAEPGRSAYWYDFANPELRDARAKSVAGRILRNGYSGVFFDTLGFEQLPRPIRNEFHSRHGNLDYNHCQSLFLARLRALLGPPKIIFLNQGYRDATKFLPYADYDLSESVFSRVSGNRTYLRPWNDGANPWESIRTPMENLIVPASQSFPRVRFVHLNYAQGGPAEVEQAILYSYAAAKLWNHDSYVVAPTSAYEEHLAYFTNLGEPTTSSYEEDVRNGMAWREYENATVVLAPASESGTRVAGWYVSGDRPSGYIFRR